MPLSEVGEKIFEALKHEGVFLHTTKHGLNLTKKSVMVFRYCGDGKKSADKLGHHKDICDEIGIDIHHLGTNGGAMWIAEHPKMVAAFPRHFSSTYPKPEMDLDEIMQSCGPDIQDTDNVGVEGHGPCGIARAAGMTVLDVVWCIVEARRKILERDPSLNVVAYYHVELPNEKRTYVIDVKRFLEIYDTLAMKVERWARERYATEVQ